VFAAWRRPWRLALHSESTRLILALGVVLAAMNSLFYLAIDRLPLSAVGAIEFLGTVFLAAAGTRTRRNAAALTLTVTGVATITAIRVTGQPLGFVFAFGNCALFMLYVILGHRMANTSRQRDLLAASMLVAAVVATPFGLSEALPAFRSPVLLLAGAGVGISSSVIPYVMDQLAMARLPRATFSLMLALLPAFATIIGLIVLRQVPSVLDVAGIALVVAGMALHRARNQEGQ
jgi:inner membrane transporter RhtA